MRVNPLKTLFAHRLLIGLFIAYPLSVSAVPGEPGDECDRAAYNASAELDVPRDLLLAITRTETGREVAGSFEPWPWAVNVSGQGYWFDGKSEATSFVRSRVAADIENVDVGCFQLNIRWHGDNFPSIEAMFDPEENALYAARYLKQMYEDTGDWLSAVAAYHSRTPEFGARYLQKFQDILANLPDSAPATPLGLLAGRHGRAPAPGAAVSLGSLVPLAGRSDTPPFIQFIN